MERVVGSNLSLRTSRYSQRPAFANVYAVAGRFLLFESEDEVTLADLNRVLSRFYLTQPDEIGSTQPDATIRFRISEPPVPTPSGFECFEVSDGGKCWTDGTTYLFDFAAGRLIVSPASPHCVEVLLKRSRNFSEAEWSQIISYAISTALRRCGLYELHSGAVIDPERGGGVLFVGPSGSGKSTLTLQLAASGWQYLTDDVLLLRDHMGTIDAHPLRRAFAITEKTLAASQHHQLSEATADFIWQEDSKWPFAPDQFFPGGFVSSCSVRAIFFSTVVREPGSRVRRLSQGEAMARLIKMCPWACYDRPMSSEYLRVMAALARQCTSFDLLAGYDLLNDRAHASRLILSEIAGHVGENPS